MDPKFLKLAEWHQAVEAADAAKLVIEKEQGLRKEVMALFFPTPTEGTNTEELNGGWKLKGVHKIERKIDEAALPGIMQRLRDEFQVNPDLMIRHRPELITKAYKSLLSINPEAIRVFDEALTIKPGSPVLEMIPPKKED